MAKWHRMVGSETSASAARTLLDYFMGKWIAIVVAALGGGGMAYLASITDWLRVWGPVAWGAIGLVSLGFIVVICYIYSLIIARNRMSEYTRIKSSTSGTNVLAATHEDERIELSQFYHPYFSATEHVRFEHCDLMGPAYTAINGCTFDGCTMSDCQVVIVRPDAPATHAVLLRFCTFVRCRLHRVVWVMTPETYATMPLEFRAGIPVISVGL
jgi:hypothetical protein